MDPQLTVEDLCIPGTLLGVFHHSVYFEDRYPFLLFPKQNLILDIYGMNEVFVYEVGEEINFERRINQRRIPQLLDQRRWRNPWPEKICFEAGRVGRRHTPFSTSYFSDRPTRRGFVSYNDGLFDQTGWFDLQSAFDSDGKVDISPQNQSDLFVIAEAYFRSVEIFELPWL